MSGAGPAEREADGSPHAPRLPVRASIYIDPDGTVHFGALFEGLIPVADALGRPAAAGEPPPVAARQEPIAAPLLPALMRPLRFVLRQERPEISALRPAALGLDLEFTPVPRADRPTPAPPPDVRNLAWVSARARAARARAPSLGDLGTARPASFRIDEEGRVASERESPALAAERPALPVPTLAARVPPAAATVELTSVDGTAFRLDPESGALPNESIIEARPQPLLPTWYLDAYDRDFYRRWTPFTYIWGLGPLQTEWFSYWWVEFREQKLGGFPYFPFREDREIKWLIILRCKEQMMIRRDVKKLETPPETSDFVYEVQGVHIQQHERVTRLAELIEKPTWIEINRIAREDRGALHPWRDAYRDWRALMGGLEEAEA